jgi:hypothetical protein
VILDELARLTEQLARLPIRAEVRWIAFRLTLGTLAAIGAVAAAGTVRGGDCVRYC